MPLQDWTNPIPKMTQGVFPGNALEAAILAAAHGIEQAVDVIGNFQKLGALRADKPLANGMRAIWADVYERSSRICFDAQATVGFADSAKCLLLGYRIDYWSVH